MLEQNVLVVFAKHLLNIHGVVEETAAHDGRPVPLVLISIGGFVAGVANQGQRTLSRWYTEYLRQVVNVPARYATSHCDAVLVRLLLQ